MAGIQDFEITLNDDYVAQTEYWPSGYILNTWLSGEAAENRYGRMRDIHRERIALEYFTQASKLHKHLAEASEPTWSAVRQRSVLKLAGFEELISPIYEAVERSRSILEIQHNWDSEDSASYDLNTWKRATTFVKDTALMFFRRQKSQLSTPRITPGPDGSIDVRWKHEKRSILINFPADPNAPADFFGYDKDRDSIKGTLDLSSQNHWLLLWLTR